MIQKKEKRKKKERKKKEKRKKRVNERIRKGLKQVERRKEGTSA